MMTPQVRTKRKRDALSVVPRMKRGDTRVHTKETLISVFSLMTHGGSEKRVRM
jgi:hypothetical protein